MQAPNPNESGSEQDEMIEGNASLAYADGGNEEPINQRMKILVVDDNPCDRQLYEVFLNDDTDQEYEFIETDMAKEGIDICTTQDIDCVLLDYDLPDMNGIEFLDTLDRDIITKIPVIMLTGHGDETIAANAMRAGASDYLPKRAVSSESLNRTIDNAVEKFHLKVAIESQTHKLQENNKILTQKNAEIQRFYQTVSHELKTPITSMKEFVCIILDGIAGPITDQQKEYLYIVKESCMQMATGVNDLLDITRLETGKYRVVLEPNDITGVVDLVSKSMQVIANHKHIKIETYFEDDLPSVYMDPGRVEQVITNLVNNSIKFTDNNGKILIKTIIDKEEEGFLKISVRDNGCGIAQEDLVNVFDRLYQVTPECSGNDYAINSGGLGLGLNICKQLVNLHEGVMNVKSKVGVGSEFSFTLPIFHEQSGVFSIIQEVKA